MELKNYKQALENYNLALKHDDKNLDYLNLKQSCINLMNQEISLVQIPELELNESSSSLTSVIDNSDSTSYSTLTKTETNLNSSDIKNDNPVLSSPKTTKRKERKFFKLFK